MDIIKMTRELGKALQADERFVKLIKAQEENEADKELQDLIGEFNLKKIELNSEIQKEERDQEKLQKLDGELKGIYQTVMSNVNMNAYNDARVETDAILSFINQIISASVAGEDPDAVEESSCGGSCSSCSGCK